MTSEIQEMIEELKKENATYYQVRVVISSIEELSAEEKHEILQAFLPQNKAEDSPATDEAAAVPPPEKPVSPAEPAVAATEADAESKTAKPILSDKPSKSEPHPGIRELKKDSSAHEEVDHPAVKRSHPAKASPPPPPKSDASALVPPPVQNEWAKEEFPLPLQKFVRRSRFSKPALLTFGIAGLLSLAVIIWFLSRQAETKPQSAEPPYGTNCSGIRWKANGYVKPAVSELPHKDYSAKRR